MEEISALSARESFALLPAQFTVSKGAIRLHARFLEGVVQGQVRVTVYRVPPHAIHSVQQGPIAVGLLEHICRELKMNVGESELLAEYEKASASEPARLRWVDFVWLTDALRA